MENESEKNEDGSKEVRIFFESGSGGIREVLEIPENLLQHDINIKQNTEVVFFSPDFGKKEGKDEMIIPNIYNGLFRMRAFLYDKEIYSEIVDTGIDDMSKVWELIAKHKPVFVGFSPYYDTMQSDLDNINRVLELSPNSIILIGGFEASLNSQWNTLGKLIDIIVYGEGEFPLLELIQQYKEFSKGKSFVKKSEFLDYLRNKPDIPGVSISDLNGTIKKIYVKERISPELYQNINLIAFEKHLSLSPIKKYWDLSQWMFKGKKDAYFRFVTSDHCPYKCIFCQDSIYYSSITGQKHSPIRYLTAESILKIIRRILDKFPFINGIMIDDENFIVHRERAVQTLKMIKSLRENGGIRKDIIFQCRTRADNIDSEICDLLKQAGFIRVSIGSESYSSDELDYMRKRTTPEKNVKAMKTIIASGLNAQENYILYTPVTTADTFYESASGICHSIGDLGVGGATGVFLNPLPGTDLWGDGNFEIVRDFPYKNDLFKDRIVFRNSKAGYEYIGKKISVPGTNIVLPHPEIVLVKDPLMRKVSLDAFMSQIESFEELKKIAGRNILSGSFITLVHLLAASKILYNLTNEKRWHDLQNKIKKIVENWRENG